MVTQAAAFLSALLLSLPSAFASTGKKTVSFAQNAEVLEFDKPVSILRKTGSASASKSSASARGSPSKASKKSVFDSDEEESDTYEELFSRPPPTLKTEKSSSSSIRPTNSHGKTSLRRDSPPPRGQTAAKKPATGLSRFKNTGPIANPILNVLLVVMDAFVAAYNEERSNEFISDEAELENLHRRQGIISRRKDPTEMILRIARPSGWLAMHMWAFYSFPSQPMLWGAMLILDLMIILGWRHYDVEWMLEEMGHWDYLFGLGVFTATGAVSLVHQAINFLSQIFFALAPGIVLLGYVLFLLYAAFKKPHHYYY